MRIITLFAVLILTCFYTYGQNLIGYSGREIQNYMKENRRDMNYEKVSNNRFKYLKYYDSADSQTLLFFFNNDSICKSVRLICDLSVKSEKVKEFNSIYRKVDDNKWIDNRNGKDFIIEVRDEKWSSTITIEPDK